MCVLRKLRHQKHTGVLLYKLEIKKRCPQHLWIYICSTVYSTDGWWLLVYIYIHICALFFFSLQIFLRRSLSRRPFYIFFIHFSWQRACRSTDKVGRNAGFLLNLSLFFFLLPPVSSNRKESDCARIDERTSLLYPTNDRRVLEVNCFIFESTRPPTILKK